MSIGSSVRLDQVGQAFSPGHVLFEGLSCRLTADNIYAVTGPSGSGKSTLLGILAGWIKPTSGTVTCDGVQSIQWVFQNPHGVAHRTALDHVTLPLVAQGMDRRQADESALKLLSEFGLSGVADSPFALLSGGEAQRLMLARGVAANPDMLLVDEPTAQLDRRTADEVNQSLKALADRGVIVVIATHDPKTASACTSVIDLEHVPAAATASVSIAEDAAPADASYRRPLIASREAAREAWRNLATGTSRAMAWALALFALTALLGGLDAWSVKTVVDGAVEYRSQGGAVWVLDAPNLVDGRACDALSGAGAIESAGALRQDSDGLTTATLPRSPIPLFSVTPGFASVVGVQSPSPGVGIWITDSVAARYGTAGSGIISTSSGPVRVDGVFGYPDDGRSGNLGFAALAPSSASDENFDQCWMTVWPADDSAQALARTALAPTADDATLSQVKFYQLNPTVASSFPGLTDFLQRPSRLAPWVALFCAAALGLVASWSRRLEQASGLHAGLPKSFLLQMTVIETAAWALPAVILASPLVIFVATQAGADNLFVALSGVRPLAAGLAGAVLGSALGVLLVHERQLFNLFKNR